MDQVKIEFHMICRGCLSSNRKLKPVKEYSSIFFTLLGEENNFNALNDTKESILCWECIAMLKKIKAFETRVQKAQYFLLDSYYQMQIEDIVSFSTLCIANKNQYDDSIVFEESKPDVEISFNDISNVVEEKSDVPLDIKREQSDDDFDTTLSDFIAKEDPDSNCTDTNEHKDVKIDRKSKYKYKQSIKQYEKFVKCLSNNDIDVRHVDKYYEKVYLNEKEMEEFFESRDRKDRSYDRMPFKCEECKLGYKRVIDIKRHNNFNHFGVTSAIRCLHCKKTLDSREDLQTHWLDHNEMLKCNICGAISKSYAEIKKHLNRFHTTIYQCTSCSSTCGTLREFSLHYQKTHERCVCDYCQKTCSTKRAMEKHIRNYHLIQRCPYCPREFVKRRTLIAHIRLDHTIGDADLAYCVECNIQYPTVSRYKRHLQNSGKHRNTKNKRVPCPECGKIFTRKNYMNNHFKQVHLKMTKNYCKPCNKFYATGFGLRTHIMRVHQKLRMPKDKICDLCGRGFSTNRILENHRRTHTGERPYQCPHCPASFAQRTAMKTHEKTQHKNVLVIDYAT